MGIPIPAGRDFASTDAHAHATAVVINQAMMQNASGLTRTPSGNTSKPAAQPSKSSARSSAGKYNSLGEDPQSFIYHPLDYIPAIFSGRSQPVRRAIFFAHRNPQCPSHFLTPTWFHHRHGVDLAIHGAASLRRAHHRCAAGSSELIALLAFRHHRTLRVISYFRQSAHQPEIGVRMALGANRLSVTQPHP